jgi:excisionase family DNA binding protein
MDLRKFNTYSTNQPANAPQPLAFSVEDAARALGIGRTITFRLIKEGKLAVVRVGRRTLVPVQEVEAFLNRNLMIG